MWFGITTCKSANTRTKPIIISGNMKAGTTIENSGVLKPLRPLLCQTDGWILWSPVWKFLPNLPLGPPNYCATRIPRTRSVGEALPVLLPSSSSHVDRYAPPPFWGKGPFSACDNYPRITRVSRGRWPWPVTVLLPACRIFETQIFYESWHVCWNLIIMIHVPKW